MPKPKAATNKIPVRNEVILSFPLADGTIRKVLIRDKIVIEDPYLKIVRANLFAIKTNSDVLADVTDRKIKNALIKQNIQI